MKRNLKYFLSIFIVAACLAAAAAYAFQAPPAMIVLGLGTHASAPVPAGWKLKVNAGKADITPDDSADQASLHFRSNKASYALERDVDIDPAQLPWLAWRWKAVELPKGGDFRHSSTDDQAAQVFVAFDARHILTYIWDTTAPAGTSGNDSVVPFVHIFAIVCRSGSADLNRWVDETHNVADDYRKAFGQPAPHVKGLRIQINSQHTGTTAESYFGEMQFHAAKP